MFFVLTMFQSGVTYFQHLHQRSRGEMSNSESLCTLHSNDRGSLAEPPSPAGASGWRQAIDAKPSSGRRALTHCSWAVTGGDQVGEGGLDGFLQFWGCGEWVPVMCWPPKHPTNPTD